MYFVYFCLLDRFGACLNNIDQGCEMFNTHTHLHLHEAPHGNICLKLHIEKWPPIFLEALNLWVRCRRRFFQKTLTYGYVAAGDFFSWTRKGAPYVWDEVKAARSAALNFQCAYHEALQDSWGILGKLGMASGHGTATALCFLWT